MKPGSDPIAQSPFLDSVRGWPYNVPPPPISHGEVEAKLRELERAARAQRSGISPFVEALWRFLWADLVRSVRWAQGVTYHDAEDAVSDVFADLLDRVTRGDWPVVEKMWRVYLYGASCNALRSTTKHLARRQLAGDFATEGKKDWLDTLPSRDPSPATALVAREPLALLAPHVDRLPPRQREVFCLRFFEDRSHAEIGRMLGIASGASRASYLKAWKHVREAVMPILWKWRECG